jgi:hypothetical protein
MERTLNQTTFRQALTRFPRFVYENGIRIVMLSILWVICSLPMITIGPATLAVYAAIQDLYSDNNAIDRSRIVSILRRNGVASIIFSGIPVAFGGLSVLYGNQALAQGSLIGEIIALIAGYITLYVGLVLIPTFSALASGVPPVTAFRHGVRWVAAHPTAILASALLTVVILAVTVLLMVAFVLLFAGVAFSLHIVITNEFDQQSAEKTASFTPTVSRQ